MGTSAVLAALLLVAFGWNVSAAASPRPAVSKTPKTKKKKKRRKRSPDEEYVRDYLEEYLSPTKMKFHRDGRVELLFDFWQRDAAHEAIFTPPLSDKVNSPFRWNVRREGFWCKKGLRVAGKGVALLDCWFEDDVEAEISFCQGTSFGPNQVAAVAFFGKKGDGVGASYGTQCVRFKGKNRKARRGKPKPMTIRTSANFKLIVSNGNFESHLNGRKKQTMGYSEEKLSVGRVGFAWGGNSAGIISSLTIVGRIDYKTMVKELRKNKQ